MNKINVAIIGGGSGAVTFIKYLVNTSLINQFYELKLSIYEPSAHLGAGLAYQPDLSTLLVNRPLQTMSVDAVMLNSFEQWLRKKPDLLSKAYVEADKPDDQRSYISRKIFGYYLNSILNEAISLAKSHGILVEIIPEMVERIYSAKPFVIQTNLGNVVFADYVVLCTGHNEPDDIYQLKGTPYYFNNPYPIEKRLAQIESKNNVGVIGNSLTAIDVALSLQQRGHKGKINLLSRSSICPTVRGKIQQYQLKFLTKQAIGATIVQKGCFSLRDALRKFRYEFKQIGYDWRFIFADDNKNTNWVDKLENEVIAAQNVRKWQAVLSATNQVIEECWHALDNNSKLIFIHRFNRIWLSKRSPIPVTNAKKLITMAKDKQLSMLAGLVEINYQENSSNYLAKFKNGEQIECDCVINASGPSRYVKPGDKLIYGLIKAGIARENRFGGIDVDFASSSVIDMAGHINPYLRVIGHNTLGVHYYTSSLQMIAQRAQKVAENLISFIRGKILHGQNSMVNAPNTDISCYPTEIIN